MAEAIGNVLVVQSGCRAALLALGGEGVAAEMFHELARENVEAHGFDELFLLHENILGSCEELVGDFFRFGIFFRR